MKRLRTELKTKSNNIRLSWMNLFDILYNLLINQMFFNTEHFGLPYNAWTVLFWLNV